MPILVQDYTWKQTEDRIFVTVPLKGIDSSKVDVFVSRCYVKLHYPPFLFELFLRHDIDDTKGKCCFTDSEAHLEFYKMECINWDCLEEELDRCSKIKIKIDAINEAHSKCAERREDKSKLRTEQERFAVSRAIEFDTLRRNRIDQQKNNERDSAMKEFEDWRVTQERIENCVNVTVTKDEVILENIVSDAGFINYDCPKETVEISLDEKRLWVTTLPNKDTNDDFRELNTVLEQCKLHETTSVDMLLDETGLSMANSVNNQMLFFANPDKDTYLYETQGVSREEIKQMPDFDALGESNPQDCITIDRDPQGYILENPIHKQSRMLVHYDYGNYIYDVQGMAVPGYQDEGETVCEENETTEISGMTFDTCKNTLTMNALAEVGSSIDLDVFQKEQTDPEPELNSVTVYVDGPSPEISPEISPIMAPQLNDIKGKYLEPIAELDETRDSFSNMIDKYTDAYMNERYDNYAPGSKNYDTDYSDFFKTPNPPEEVPPECSIQPEVNANNSVGNYDGDRTYNFFGTPLEPIGIDSYSTYSEGDTACTDDFLPEDYVNLSTPCLDPRFTGINQQDDVGGVNKCLYGEEDVSENVGDGQEDGLEQYTDVELTPHEREGNECKTCHQLGVELSVDEKGCLTGTKQINRFTDCSEQEAQKFFCDTKLFGSSSDCMIGEIDMEKEFTENFGLPDDCVRGELYVEKEIVDCPSDFTIGDVSVEKDISKETVGNLHELGDMVGINENILNEGIVDSVPANTNNIEALLKEQCTLLKEHMISTEKKFEELKKKLDICCEKKIKQGSGDTALSPRVEKRGSVRKERITKEIMNTALNNKGGKPVNRNAGGKPVNIGGKPVNVGVKPVNVGVKPVNVEVKPVNVGVKPVNAGVKPVSRDVGLRREANKVTSPRKTPKKVIPPLRKTQTMNISFTERAFPTPCRESSAKEEEEWLKNVNECRRATGFACEDLRPEEQDPVWCKDKGDQFYKCGNHLGAVSAYSHGIKMCDKMPSLYSNRAACHLALGNYNKCIEDCSSALDLLKPACPSNCDSRAKCIARRAVALTMVGMLGKGIDEMKAAVQLQPHNCQLKDDLYCMERAWEQNPDSD